MHFITFTDYFLLPVYLLLIYLVASKIQDRFYPVGHPWRPYFLPGLAAKVIGGIFIGLVYQYYYGYGDTANYFIHAKIINSSFMESPIKWFNLTFRIPDWFDPEYAEYVSQMIWYETPGSYIVSTATALVGVFCYTTFLPCTVLMAAISYSGMWALFRTFAKQYPSILKQVAIACLFIPSVAMWGSGIFKDTLCLFALGWMTHIVFGIFIQGRISLINLLLLVLSFYILLIAKIYILIAYVPSMALWVLLNYSGRIQAKAVRTLLQASVVSVCLIGFVVANSFFAKELGQYSLDNLSATSAVTRDYIVLTTESEGSSYDLDLTDQTPLGLLKKLPAAINVTLFRPYLWEARKPIVMLSAIEAFVILLLTVKVLVRVGPRRILNAIASDANIQFCLIFSLIFAFAVGISSYNFGSLSRYRIPCIPMYVLAIILIYYKYNPPQKSIFDFKLWKD